MSKPKKLKTIENPSRRDFVKTSAVVISSAALASGVSIARAAHFSGDDEIKIALIGCGGRGTGAAGQALRTEGKVKLWAMADAFLPKVTSCLGRLERDLSDAKAAKKPGALTATIDVPPERQFAGFDAYQQAIDSGVDLVILTTPPGFRPLQLEAAIAADKHVFMEKPVAVDAPGIRRVLAAGKEAEKKGLAVAVGLQRHHQAGYIETIQRLQDGAIGDIQLTKVYWNGGGVWVRTRADFETANGHAPTEMEYQVNNWYYFNWLCGDHINEQHIHNLDVSNWLKGGPPVEASGMGGRQVRKGKDHGQIFDHHFVDFTYADGSTMMSQCRHIPGCSSKVDEFAVGTAGTAHIGGNEITGYGGDWKFKGKRVDPYQQEHDDLFAAIRRGDAYSEAEYGAHSTMTAIMGRMATYSGKIIKWEDAINSQIDLSPSVYSFDAAPPVVPDADGNYPVPEPGKSVVV